MSSVNGKPPGPDRETAPTAGAVPSPKVDGPLTSGRPLRPVALAIVTVALIALCVYLAKPLIPALTWGLALGIIAWPLHVWISRHVRQPTVAAVLSTAAVCVLVLAPGLFVSYELAHEATSAAERMKEQSAEGVLRQSMEKTPGLRGVVEWADRVNVDIDKGVRDLIASYTQDASYLIEGSVAAILQAVVALFVLYHLFRDRAYLTQRARGLLPLTKDESDQVFRRVGDSVHANLYATLVTSAIDAVGGGLMFWMLGLPSPVLWAVVMFILSILPILGTFIVWMPAGIYLALIGQWPSAVALVAWGVAGWIVVDNYIYVKLAGNRMRLHEVPALIAFLGGMYCFGASGMILGPAILAVTVAVLEVWHRRAVFTPHTPAPADPLVAVSVSDGGPAARRTGTPNVATSEVTV
jgi:predicted PurR-regulated permease PerM